uniref:T9SS type A sorting domain-containing protein n=1 Tax=candidate division WOR-3 bacterium TaxID=2052148 RepID=A0A7V3RIS6_UNCW3
MNFLNLFFFAITLKPVYYTNHNYFYSIVATDSMIFGATNGGVVSYNYHKDIFSTITSTEGLTINRQKCIAIDSGGNIWVGSNGGLAQIDKSFSQVHIYPLDRLPSTRINTIHCLKDTILVGTENGLLLIDTKGTYEDFQDDWTLKIYDYNGLSSNNILTIDADTDLWIGTDEKITRISKDLQNFTIYGIENGLLSNYIRKIKIIDTMILVGTDKGLNRFLVNRFDTLIIGYKITDIAKFGDSVLLALDSLQQVGVYFQGNLTIVNNGLPALVEINDVETFGDKWFCACGNAYRSDYFGEGIGIFDFENQKWELKKDACLGSNHICSITANEYGIFCAHGTRNAESRGVSWLTSENKWFHFCQDSLIPTKFIHRCVTSPDKKVWFAFHYTDSLLACSFNPSNNTWYYLKQSYGGIDNTVALWDLKFDLKNNMYLSLAGPSDKIWVYDSALTSACFLGDRTPGFEVELAIDSSLKVWSTVFDAAGGVLMIDTRGTIFYRGDDINLKYGKTDGLLSQFCSGITVDENNDVYIANEIGISVYHNGKFESIQNFNGGTVYDVLYDGEGRIWIMASNGVYFYDIYYKSLQGFKYTDLGVHIDFLPVSNEIIQVQGFFYDPLRSCLWLGGETGLLKLEIIKSDTISLDSALIYPNPALSGSVVRIKNVPVDASVSIYSISGRKIVENLKTNSLGEVLWRIPDNVPSGLYFALVRTPTKNRVYKFSIIH